MKVTVESGYIIIRLKLCKPRRSKSGKSMLIASSRGTKKSGIELRGKDIRVVACAFYYCVEPRKTH